MLRAVASSAGGGGSGDVVGPGSSTLNATARFADTSGELLKDSSFWTTTDNGASTILGPTATSPGFYAGLTGDTSARISLGVNASDVARIGFGPGGATARETFITRGTGGGVAITNGTVTTSIPVLALTQTWNAAQTFTSISLDVTNTSSNTASKFIDLMVGGVSQFAVTRTGLVTSGPGTTSFRGTSPNTGGIIIQGSSTLSFANGQSTLSGSLSIGTNAWIAQDGANILALRNVSTSTTAQTLRLYRTASSTSGPGTDYERLAFQSGAGYMEVAAETGGAGTANIDLRLTPSATGAAVDFRNPVNGAAAAAGTITNAPSVGNPAYWLKIKIAGTVHYIPAWT